jgi:hypothetical protein
MTLCRVPPTTGRLVALAATALAIVGACAGEATRPAATPRPVPRVLPYQAELDKAFRYVSDDLEDISAFDGPTILKDTIARLTATFPGAVAATPLAGGGWSLRSRDGAIYKTRPPPNLFETRVSIFSTVSLFYEALADGPPHSGPMAPERFALAGLFCNLDQDSTLLTPQQMKELVSFAGKDWERWAQAAELDQPVPSSALCAAEPRRPTPPAPPLGPDQVVAGQFYCTGPHMRRGFAQDLRRRLQQATMENLAPLTGVIFDLRGSAGGLYDESTSTADLFLPAGPGLVMKSRRGNKTFETRTKDDAVEWDTPLVVLIDGGTAAGSEMLAALLQERNRALLIGSRTLGRGTIQVVFDMAFEHGALKLTTARIETAGGRSIESRGVSPDVMLPSGAKDAKVPTAPDPEAAVVLPPSPDPFAPVRFAQRVLATARGRDRKALLDAARKLAANPTDTLADGE